MSNIKAPVFIAAIQNLTVIFERIYKFIETHVQNPKKEKKAIECMNAISIHSNHFEKNCIYTLDCIC
jgi:hypothetical protein